MSFPLTITQFVLKGLWPATAQKPDNEWTSLKIDLNDFIGRNNDLTRTGWFNSAFLDGQRLKDTLVFAALITTHGQSVLVKQFDRDGWIIKWLENMPVLGYVVAGTHWVAGNEDYTARAIAKCTNSTLVMFGTIVGGLVCSVFANPVIGIVIGAGIASPFGIWAETQIAIKCITDPAVRDQIEEATLGRYIFETLRNIVSAGAAGALAKALSTVLKPGIDAVMKGIMASLAKRGILIGTNVSLYAILKKVITLLKGGLVKEWDDAIGLFNEAKQRIAMNEMIEMF